MTSDGPPQWPQQPPPGWHPPGHPAPQAYPEPHAHPAPWAYPVPPHPAYSAYGYPMPVGPGTGPRVSKPWTGVLTGIAGLAVAIGSVMTWAKAVALGTTVEIAGTDGSRDGKFTLVLGILLAGIGIVIAVKQGRLWASIVAIVLSALGLVTALVDIGDISDRSQQLEPFGHVDVGPGLVIVLIASLVALGGSIVAISVRRVMHL